MHTPSLNCGDVIFLPQHGMRVIEAIDKELVAGSEQDICSLRHYFTDKTERRAITSLINGKARPASSNSVAVTALGQLGVPPTKPLTGRWEQQEVRISTLMRTGTLEQNVRALRLLFHINQSAWSRSRIELYQKVLRCVSEEVACIFSETYKQSEKKILDTLVRHALERT